MPEEPRTPGGWLPPTAPGGQPPPHFDARPRPEPPAPPPEPPQWEPPAGGAAPAWQGPATAPPQRTDRPTFVTAGPETRNPTAVWALVLGIAGLALLLMSLGTLFLVTLPCSIAAWVLALRARAQGPGAENQITAALWLGRIGVLVSVAAAVVLIVLLASGFDFEQLRQDLERELERQRQQDEDGGGSGVRTAVEGLRAVLGLG